MEFGAYCLKLINSNCVGVANFETTILELCLMFKPVCCFNIKINQAGNKHRQKTKHIKTSSSKSKRERDPISWHFLQQNIRLSFPFELLKLVGVCL